MGMRCEHYAVTDRELEALRGHGGMDYFFDAIADDREAHFAADTDKAWTSIFFTLTNSDPTGDVDLNAGQAPLNLIFGEDNLGNELGLISKETAVREELEKMSRQDFASRFEALFARYDPVALEHLDVEWTSDRFEEMKSVFRAATDHDRHIICMIG